MRIPKESDLKSTVDKTWAEAVMQCKGHNPYCGADGYCHNDGSCFIDQEMTREQALREIMHMQKELDDARFKYSQIEAKHMSLISRLKAEKGLAVKGGKSERAFAIGQCLRVLEA